LLLLLLLLVVVVAAAVVVVPGPTLQCASSSLSRSSLSSLPASA
jgi:hypothetical protein